MPHRDEIVAFYADPVGNLIKEVECVGRKYLLVLHDQFMLKVPSSNRYGGCFCCEQRGNPDAFLATYITHDGSDYENSNSDTSYICPVCFNDGWRQHDFEVYEGPDAKAYINVNDPDYAKDVAMKASRT
jgi:hypothetical protein